MMTMMMVKRSVVTSHKADGPSASLLSPFVNVDKVFFKFHCCVVDFFMSLSLLISLSL